MTPTASTGTTTSSSATSDRPSISASTGTAGAVLSPSIPPSPTPQNNAVRHFIHTLPCWRERNGSFRSRLFCTVSIVKSGVLCYNGLTAHQEVYKSYETRHRGFMPISFIRLNSYEMSQSLIVQGLRDLAASCTLMFQYELSRKNVAEMWRAFRLRRNPATKSMANIKHRVFQYGYPVFYVQFTVICSPDL